MAKLVVIALYLQALLKTLVVPCVTNPDNWKYCFNDWDQWLYPELVRGWELYTGQEVPYAAEHDTLEAWQNEHPSKPRKPSDAS